MSIGPTEGLSSWWPSPDAICIFIKTLPEGLSQQHWHGFYVDYCQSVLHVCVCMLLSMLESESRRNKEDQLGAESRRCICWSLGRCWPRHSQYGEKAGCFVVRISFTLLWCRERVLVKNWCWLLQCKALFVYWCFLRKNPGKRVLKIFLSLTEATRTEW